MGNSGSWCKWQPDKSDRQVLGKSGFKKVGSGAIRTVGVDIPEVVFTSETRRLGPEFRNKKVTI